MNARDVIRLLQAAGWREVRAKGSHRQFQHPDKAGTATVPAGARLERHLPTVVLRSIERQTGVRLRKE
jgi:predicted RNA binding protein YcfA (HicA-like mRNA interferase family)